MKCMKNFNFKYKIKFILLSYKVSSPVYHNPTPFYEECLRFASFNHKLKNVIGKDILELQIKL